MGEGSGAEAGEGLVDVLVDVMVDVRKVEEGGGEWESTTHLNAKPPGPCEGVRPSKGLRSVN